MSKTILIVDDEPDIRDLISYNLTREGFICETAANGKEALAKLEHSAVALVILDIMMPELDGFDTCRAIRANPKTATIPVLFLTARHAEVDQIVSLELGGDDYVQKPVSPRVLVARVKSLLRRSDRVALGTIAREQIISPGLKIDRGSYKVFVDETEIPFPRKEFELLFFLASHPGRIFKREVLLDEVWGRDMYVVERTVDVHIFKLREKLGKYGSRIETVKGVGYRYALEG
ncbi:MAG: response regulator transcription factor [Bacteroidota bacterium]|nr:response regulator transcription factor [Bacteroidota bacterium]MDP4234233.1 response regulator transcription factor [Bacteroidota bacterium]MDP4243423.1 response regulator transcription factor [Bacteroidota bacterium]MDP4288122.1 response regulator transcription factor [Bacteroidota bacterium]